MKSLWETLTRSPSRGVLLVFLLALALLCTGRVPAPDRIPGQIFSWHKAPPAVRLVLTLTAPAMQQLAVAPTFVLAEMDTDLLRAMRSNWRPLACWALSGQALLFVGGGLMPIALVVLTPMLALAVSVSVPRADVYERKSPRDAGVGAMHRSERGQIRCQDGIWSVPCCGNRFGVLILAGTANSRRLV